MRLTLSDAFAAMDANEDGRVTAQEWDQMKKDPWKRDPRRKKKGLRRTNIVDRINMCHYKIDTSIISKQKVAEYLGIPTGKELRKL